MFLRPIARTEVRRNRYKVVVDAEEGRRMREDNMVEIRKNKREESLLKKLSSSVGVSATVYWCSSYSNHHNREKDFIVDERVDPHAEEGVRRMHHRPLLSCEDDQEDVEALERIIQERFARNRTSDDDDDATEVEQQALLPSVCDPKLWMVKCAIGHEREVTVCLMQKCIDRGSELQIRSAIALDHLKNYIDIEVDKEAHVKEVVAL